MKKFMKDYDEQEVIERINDIYSQLFLILERCWEEPEMHNEETVFVRMLSASLYADDDDPTALDIAYYYLRRICYEVESFVESCEILGVCDRWVKIDPNLMYFDYAFDLIGSPEGRQLIEKQPCKFMLNPTERDIQDRRKYLDTIRKECKETGMKFSIEKAFYLELLRALEMVFVKDLRPFFYEYTPKLWEQED